MTIQNALASLAVRDLEAAERWYTALLGAAPSHPMPELAEWKLSGGGGLQLYVLPERAGRGSVTLVVDDLKAAIGTLESMSVDTSERTSNAKVKTVMVTDTDGNHVALAEALDSSLVR